MNIYLLKDCGNHELVNEQHLIALKDLSSRDYTRTDGFFYNCVKYLREFLGV